MRAGDARDRSRAADGVGCRRRERRGDPRLLARPCTRARPRPARLEADARGRRISPGRSAPTRRRSAYLPHQVFIGNLHPDALWEIERPWWRNPVEPRAEGPFGAVIPQSELYRRMAEADAFQLFRLDGSEFGAADLRRRHVPRLDDGGARRGREPDRLGAAREPRLQSDRRACPRHLLAKTAFPADELEYAIGCGEEAIGDRYQRGGGNLAKAVAEAAGCGNATG